MPNANMRKSWRHWGKAQLLARLKMPACGAGVVVCVVVQFNAGIYLASKFLRAPVTMMNQMPLCFFSSRDKAVSDCTSDAETKALHYGTANCNQFVLKLLSYLTPIY